MFLIFSSNLAYGSFAVDFYTLWEFPLDFFIFLLFMVELNGLNLKARALETRTHATYTQKRRENNNNSGVGKMQPKY